MPRRWRVDRRICHVCNRAAAKLPLFKSAEDYRAFLAILARTKLEFEPAVKLHGYCIMPNHWHFIICADTTALMSHFMRHVTRRHAVAHIAEHPGRSGAIYQGRFRCVPVQDGDHLSTVLLYVDRNPLRAKLVSRAEDWLWSSVIDHAGLENDPLLDPLPRATFANWLERVNHLGPSDTLISAAIKRNVPLGDPEWIGRLSQEWNVLRRPKGRPGKIIREEFPL